MLLTDGIIESENDCGDEFGIDGAILAIVRHRNEPAREIARHVKEAVYAFRDGSPLADDVTIVVCKVSDFSSTARPRLRTRAAARNGMTTP